jgi:hypothetical protein
MGFNSAFKGLISCEHSFSLSPLFPNLLSISKPLKYYFKSGENPAY